MKRKNGKKLMAVMMAVSMMAASSTTAFAANITDEGEKSASTDVLGTVKEYVNVDISWGDMEYTYRPQTDDWDWTNPSDEVTVTNHSTIGIDAGLAFTPTAVGGSVIEAAAADFRSASKGDDTTKITALSLEAGNATEAGVEKKAYLKVTDGQVNARTTIGQIVVTITKKAAQPTE